MAAFIEQGTVGQLLPAGLSSLSTCTAQHLSVSLSLQFNPMKLYQRFDLNIKNKSFLQSTYKGKVNGK